MMAAPDAAEVAGAHGDPVTLVVEGRRTVGSAAWSAQRLLAELVGGDAEGTVREKGLLRLDTKYYTATTRLVVASLPGGLGPAADALTATDVEAVCLLIDTAEVGVCQRLEGTAKALADEHAAEILLLFDCNQSRNVDRSGVLEWCANEGFELVTSFAPLPQGEEDTDDDSGGIIVEQRGVDRVREALGVHIWPGLVMKDGRGAPSTAEVAAPEPEPKPEPEPEQPQPASRPLTAARMCGNPACFSLDLDGRTFKRCSRCRAVFYCSLECQRAAWKGGHGTECVRPAPEEPEANEADQEFNIDRLVQNLERLDVVGRKAENGGDDVSDDLLEENDEMFASVIQQMQQFREQAGNLSDEKRRDYAEKVALSLWGALGGDDDEDSGHESSDAR